MAFIQKKDDKQEEDGIEIIGRGEGPDPSDEKKVELVVGESAENIALHTTEAAKRAEGEQQMLADAQDEALMEGIATKDDEEESFRDNSSDTDDSDEGDEEMDSDRRKIYGIAAVLIFVALALGYLIGNGAGTSGGTGSATITESQLSTTVASWTYNGQTHTLTAQEVIETNSSLESAADEDGNYAAPTADTVLSCVRNQILLAEAESQGIEVTDDEVDEYAENNIGSSDYAEIGESYGYTEEQAKQVVKENAILSKLYEQVVPEIDATMPDAPTEPEDGNEETASQEYATYIIELAGDEWDSETGTWASEDGEYYAALEGEEFSAESATYAQAEIAYNLAYEIYYEAYSEASSAWAEFANGLYAAASVQIWGLYV